MALYIADCCVMVHNIISSCTLLRRQIVFSFTHFCTPDTVSTFIAELQSSVQQRIRGERFVSSRNRRDYKFNLSSRRVAINLRIFIDLLAIQLSLFRNLELDGTATNNYRYTINFIRELRLELHNFEYKHANWRVD